MKSAETKIASSTSHQSHQDAKSPFFKKDGEGTFFSERSSDIISPKAEEPFFSPSTIQPKLKIGQPNDKYEKEADATAERVVKQISKGESAPKDSTTSSTPNQIQTKCATCESEGELQRMEDEEISMKELEIQRKPIFESAEEPPEDNTVTIQRKCATCEKEEMVQKMSSDNNTPTPSADFQSQLNSSKGGGSPLSKDTRSSMESAFGTDFGNVRIHDNSSASEMSQSIGAQAFTHGSDIYFNEGKYDTRSSDGQKLLAHELTHTVQQGGSKMIQKNDDDDTEITEYPNINEVTAPSDGSIVKAANGDITITLNELRIKANSDPAILDELPSPNPISSANSRDTNQEGIWRGMVHSDVQNSIRALLDTFQEDVSRSEKERPRHTYMLRQRSRGTSMTGNFTQLVNNNIVPKWGRNGDPMAFQIEHILDYQIAGAKSDDERNMMLLNAGNNQYLGRIIREYIKEHIESLLTYYNSRIAPGELTNNADRAREQYRVVANGYSRVPFTLFAGVTLFDIDFDPEIPSNPLHTSKVELAPLSVPQNHFILKTGARNAGVILPYGITNQQVGSYRITVHGNSTTGVQSIDATKIITGNHTNLPETINYSVEPVSGENHTYRVLGDFGSRGLRRDLTLAYLSPIEFNEIEVDSNLNIVAFGQITTPSPSFLNNTPIEISLIGTTLSIEKTFSADQLASVGPFSIDYSSFTIGLNSETGLNAGGSIGFSIDRVGSGDVTASGNANGFSLTGSFGFESEKLDGRLTANYNSDTENGDTWSIEGTIDIRNVRGIRRASLTIGYESENETLSGSATDIELDVPGIEVNEISISYGTNTGNFQFNIAATISDRIPGVESATIEASLGSGEGEDGEGNSGLNLSISGSAQFRSIPGIENPRLTISYDNQTNVIDISATLGFTRGKVSGDVLVGVTNRAIVEGEPQEEAGDTFFIYGGGSLEVEITENFKPRISAVLQPDGNLILDAELPINFEIGEGFELDKSLFTIRTPDIPIFTIGVASVMLRAGGGLGIFATVNPLRIEGSLAIRNFNPSHPESFTATANAAAIAHAEAGLRFSAFLEVMGVAAILYAAGRVTLNMDIGAEADARLTGGITWSPSHGLEVARASAELDLAIVANIAAELEASAGIYLYVGRLPVWSDVFPLGQSNFPPLASMNMSFPIGYERGQILQPSTNELQPQNNPLDDSGSAGEFLQSGVTGEQAEPEQAEVRNYRREVRELLESVMDYPVDARRDMLARFVSDLERVSPDEDFAWVEEEWADMEFLEFARFRVDLLLSDMTTDEKIAEVDEFEYWHVYIPPEDYAQLRHEIYEMEEPGFSPVQRKPNNSNIPNANSSIERSLNNSKGKGQKISDDVRGDMESNFGNNFDDVRIHTDEEAVQMSDDLNAQAFTHGSDIYFNEGKYNPETDEGKELLAHELTHTVQQGESKTPNNIQKYDLYPVDIDLSDDRDEPSAPAPPKVTEKMETPEEWYNQNKKEFWFNLENGEWMKLIDNKDRFIVPSALGLDKKFDLDLSINESRILAYVFDYIKMSSWDKIKQYSDPYKIESTIRRILLSRGPLPIDRREGEYQYYADDVLYYNREIEKNIKIIFANRVRESLPKLIFQFIAGSYKKMMEAWKALPYEDQHEFKHVPPHPQSRDRKGYKLPTKAKYPKTQFPDAGFIIPSHPIHKAIIFSLLGGKNSGIPPIKIFYNNLIYNFKDKPENILAGQIVLRPVTKFEWNTKGEDKKWIKVLQPSEATPEEVSTALYGDAALASEIINATPIFGFKPGLLKLDLKLAWVAISLLGSEQGTDTFLETAILNQSKKFEPTGASQEEIKNRMGFSLMLLKDISTKIESIGGKSGVGKKVQNRLTERIQILKISKDASLSIKWDAHSLAQKNLIKNIHKAIDKAKFIYAQINPDNKQKKEGLPPYIQTTFFDILNGYSEAMDQSDLLETATALFNTAENRSKTLETDQLESQLHQVHESLKEDFKVNRDITDENAKERDMEDVHENTQKTDIEQLRKQEQLLREQVYLLKSSDPNQRKVAVEKLKILKEKTLHLKEISTLSQWLNHLENFGEFIDKNNEISLSGAVTRRDSLFWELSRKAHTMYLRYWSIYLTYQDTFKLWGEYESDWTQEWNRDRIMEARKKLNLELKHNIQKDIATLKAWHEKAKDRLAIEKWVSLGFKILATVAVGVVSGGVGSLAGGGLRLGLGWGGTTGRTIAAGVLATGAEAATATGISSIIGLSDPSKGFFDSFVENFIATGLVKSVAKTWDLSIGTKTLKTVAGKEITSLTVSLSWSLYNANKEALKKTGKGLTDEQVAETVVQEVGMAIGGLILKRFGVDKLNAKLELKGAELMAKTSLKLGFTPTDIKFTNDLGQVNRLRVEAFLAAEKLRKKPTETLIKEAATKDLASLKSEFELMAQMRRWAMSKEGRAAAKLQGIDPADLNAKILATQKEHDSREAMSLLLELKHEGGVLYSAPSEKLKGIVDRYNKLAGYKASLTFDKVTGRLHAIILPANGQASFRILESAPQSKTGSKTTKTKFKLSEMYLSLKSTEAQEAFDTILQQDGPKKAFQKFSRWSKKKGGLEKVLLNKNKNISIENLNIEFYFGGGRHTIKIKKIGNQLIILMCTTCGPIIDKVDRILSGLDAKGSTKTLHASFVKLQNRLKYLQNQINEGTVTKHEAEAQIKREISTLAGLERELKFHEIKMLVTSNPLAARKKLASVLAKMQKMKVGDVLKVLEKKNIEPLDVIREMELIELLSERGQLVIESDSNQDTRLHNTYSIEDVLKVMRRRTRSEDTRLEKLPKNTDPNNYEDFIPRPQHEFQEWFDALTTSEFETLWSNPAAKEVIANRTRAPGGFHEWLKVSQLPKLKQWGISMKDIHEFRTLTDETVGRTFVHGGDGSTEMHNTLDRLFNESTSYKQFLRKLNDWADIELINGRYSLPRGLQMKQTE